MTRSASIVCSTPSPPHSGQAPNGLLNENSRGSISEMVKPDTGQANFSENSSRCGPLCWSWILATAFLPSPERGGSARDVGEGSSERPPPDRFAVDLPLSGEG